MKYLARFIMWLGGWRFRGKIAGRKKSGDYLRTAYFKLGFPYGENWHF